MRRVVHACRAVTFTFTAKPLQAARARVAFVQRTVLKNRTARTVLDGIVVRNTLSNTTEVYYMKCPHREGLRGGQGAHRRPERSATDRTPSLLL